MAEVTPRDTALLVVSAILKLLGRMKTSLGRIRRGDGGEVRGAPNVRQKGGILGKPIWVCAQHLAGLLSVNHAKGPIMVL